MFNLTISVRSVWSDNTFQDSEKVEQMKWLNELQHRIMSKLRGSWPHSDIEFFAEVLQFRVRQCPALKGHVAWAVEQSFGHLSASPPAV